jgi:hypothetical protein
MLAREIQSRISIYTTTDSERMHLAREIRRENSEDSLQGQDYYIEERRNINEGKQKAR